MPVRLQALSLATEPRRAAADEAWPGRIRLSSCFTAARLPPCSRSTPAVLVPRALPTISSCLSAARSPISGAVSTTTYEDLAKQWANTQVRRVASSSPVAPIAAVIRFQVDQDDLTKLEDPVSVLDNADTYDLVGYCRSGSAPTRAWLREI